MTPDGRGYVLSTSRLRAHLSEKLAEFTTNEDFRCTISIPETNESTIPGTDAIALKSFPAFYLTFAASDSAENPAFRLNNIFPYSIVLSGGLS
jgi:hypothetical protein